MPHKVPIRLNDKFSKPIKIWVKEKNFIKIWVEKLGFNKIWLQKFGLNEKNRIKPNLGFNKILWLMTYESYRRLFWRVVFPPLEHVLVTSGRQLTRDFFNFPFDVIQFTSRNFPWTCSGNFEPNSSLAFKLQELFFWVRNFWRLWYQHSFRIS